MSKTRGIQRSLVWTLIGMVGAASSWSEAQATSRYVCGDPQSGQCAFLAECGEPDPEPCYTSIEDALGAAVAGDQIHLNGETFDEAVSIIVGGLTMRGQGQGQTVIRPSDGSDPVLHVSADNVVIEDLTLDGEGSRQGLDVSESKNLEISRVTLINGEAHRGGGAHFYRSRATLSEVTFHANVSTGTGGQGGGGHLYLDGAGTEVTVVDSVFSEGNAARRGGAIFLNGSEDPSPHLDLVDSEILENYASQGQGGGLALNGKSTARLEGVSFLRNGVRSGGEGGAVALYDGEPELEVEGGQFVRNESGVGGALSVRDGGLIIIERAAFDRNFAREDGGAIFAEGALTVKEATFFRNQAHADGGAVFCGAGGASACLVEDSLFRENGALNGGGLSFEERGGWQVRRAVLCDNVALNNGGGVFMDGGSGSVQNSFFLENQGGGGSGGLQLGGGNLQSSQNHWVGNHSWDGTGAFRVGDGVLTSENDLFVRNDGRGEVAFGPGGHLELSYAWFFENLERDHNLEQPEGVQEGDPGLVDLRVLDCDPFPLRPEEDSPLLQAGAPDDQGDPTEIGAFGGPDALDCHLSDCDDCPAPFVAQCEAPDPDEHPDEEHEDTDEPGGENPPGVDGDRPPTTGGTGAAGCTCSATGGELVGGLSVLLVALFARRRRVGQRRGVSR